MECPSSRQLATVVLQLLLALPTPPQRARVLGISGYPYTGKSHLAMSVQAAWPTREVTLLPTESVVLSRTSRRVHRADGCSPEGHDMLRLLRHVTSLRSGWSSACKEYSWLSGRALQTSRLHGVGNKGLLIVDGTVAAAHPILEQCDLVVFLSPLEEETWLPLACRRDVSERGWPEAQARSQNLLKSRTSAALQESAQRSLCVSVRVNPVSWTWYLPGCDLCEQRRRHSPVQAAVSVSSCKLRQRL